MPACSFGQSDSAACHAGWFVLVSFVRVNAAKRRRAACAQLLTRINARLGLGHFDLALGDREIAFRTVVPIGRKSRLRQSVIEDVIRGHQLIVDDFIPPISAVLFAVLTPEKRFEREAELDNTPAPMPRFSPK